jgi:2-phospho-L-lactate guanylyltransferase (CobY/MobA/RfbA family)
MFKDLAMKLSKVAEFEEKIVYSNDSIILDLAEKYNLIGIKEFLTHPRKSFDQVIDDVNQIALNEFHAQSTVFTFLDTVLISPKNFKEIHKRVTNNSLVICPAIHSAGISVIGRNPPDIISTFFSDPSTPSFIAQVEAARSKGLKISIYDSIRAGFDIDIKQDLVLAYEYLNIFDLTDTETFQFLKTNLSLSIEKGNPTNNRELKLS